MGMSLNAYVCVGAIIQSEDFRENESLVSEEELEEKYDGYLSEYFYALLEPFGIGIEYTGYMDSYVDSELIVYLANTVSSGYYGAGKVDMTELREQNIGILKEKLKSVGITYSDIGIFVFPIYG